MPYDLTSLISINGCCHNFVRYIFYLMVSTTKNIFSLSLFSSLSWLLKETTRYFSHLFFSLIYSFLFLYGTLSYLFIFLIIDCLFLSAYTIDFDSFSKTKKIIIFYWIFDLWYRFACKVLKKRILASKKKWCVCDMKDFVSL
jgi:hypothetical protein